MRSSFCVCCLYIRTSTKNTPRNLFGLSAVILQNSILFLTHCNLEKMAAVLLNHLNARSIRNKQFFDRFSNPDTVRSPRNQLPRRVNPSSHDEKRKKLLEKPFLIQNVAWKKRRTSISATCWSPIFMCDQFRSQFSFDHVTHIKNHFRWGFFIIVVIGGGWKIPVPRRVCVRVVIVSDGGKNEVIFTALLYVGDKLWRRGIKKVAARNEIVIMYIFCNKIK